MASAGPRVLGAQRPAATAAGAAALLLLLLLAAASPHPAATACAAVAGCMKLDAATCECITAKAGYTLLPAGAPGCAAGFGAFMAATPPNGTAAARSKLPQTPPTCPSKACVCKACPAGTGSAGGLPISLSPCWPADMPAYVLKSSDGSQIARLRVWYQSDHTSIVGVGVTWADGTSSSVGQQAGAATELTTPDAIEKFTVYQTGQSVQALVVTTTTGGRLAAGYADSSAPATATSAGGGAALGGFAGVLAYPGGPLASLQPLFVGACAENHATDHRRQLLAASGGDAETTDNTAAIKGAQAAAKALVTDPRAATCKITGCQKLDKASCTCITPRKGYTLLTTGQPGCAAGFGAFMAVAPPNATAAARSKLPRTAPDCPSKACVCKACPAGTGSAGGMPIALSPCWPASMPPYNVKGIDASQVTRLRVWYQAELAYIAGVEVAWAGGTSSMVGQQAGAMTELATPDQVVNFTVYATGVTVQALELTTATGARLAAGDPNPTVPATTFDTPAGGSLLTGVSGVLAHPGGPLASVTPVYSKACEVVLAAFGTNTGVGGTTNAKIFVTAITGWYNPGSGIIDGLRQQLSDGSTITTGLPQGTQQTIAAPSGITTITVRATATGVQYMEALGLGTAQRSSPLRRLAAAKKDGGVLLGVIGNPASTAPETIETSPTPLTGFTGTQVSGGPLLSLSGTFAPPAFQCPAGSVLKAGTNTTCVGCNKPADCAVTSGYSGDTIANTVCTVNNTCGCQQGFNRPPGEARCIITCPAGQVLKSGTTNTCVECNVATDCTTTAGYLSANNAICATDSCNCVAGAVLTAGRCEFPKPDCTAAGLVPLTINDTICVKCNTPADCLTTSNFTSVTGVACAANTCGCNAPYVDRGGYCQAPSCPADTVLKASDPFTCVKCNTPADCMTTSGFTNTANLACTGNTCDCNAPYVDRGGYCGAPSCPAGTVAKASDPFTCVKCNTPADCLATSAFTNAANVACASNTCGCSAPYVNLGGYCGAPPCPNGTAPKPGDPFTCLTCNTSLAIVPPAAINPGVAVNFSASDIPGADETYTWSTYGCSGTPNVSGNTVTFELPDIATNCSVCASVNTCGSQAQVCTPVNVTCLPPTIKVPDPITVGKEAFFKVLGLWDYGATVTWRTEGCIGDVNINGWFLNFTSYQSAASCQACVTIIDSMCGGNVVDLCAPVNVTCAAPTITAPSTAINPGVAVNFSASDIPGADEIYTWSTQGCSGTPTVSDNTVTFEALEIATGCSVCVNANSSACGSQAQVCTPVNVTCPPPTIRGPDTITVGQPVAFGFRPVTDFTVTAEYTSEGCTGDVTIKSNYFTFASAQSAASCSACVTTRQQACGGDPVKSCTPVNVTCPPPTVIVPATIAVGQGVTFQVGDISDLGASYTWTSEGCTNVAIDGSGVFTFASAQSASCKACVTTIQPICGGDAVKSCTPVNVTCAALTITAPSTAITPGVAVNFSASDIPGTDETYTWSTSGCSGTPTVSSNTVTFQFPDVASACSVCASANSSTCGSHARVCMPVNVTCPPPTVIAPATITVGQGVAFQVGDIWDMGASFTWTSEGCTNVAIDGSGVFTFASVQSASCKACVTTIQPICGGDPVKSCTPVNVTCAAPTITGPGVVTMNQPAVFTASDIPGTDDTYTWSSQGCSGTVNIVGNSFIFSSVDTSGNCKACVVASSTACGNLAMTCKVVAVLSPPPFP